MATFICGFCLSRIEVADYPTACPHCDVTRCENCYTYIKGEKPKFCHGCGAIPPMTKPDIVRSSSTAAAYLLYQWWPRRTLGAEASKQNSGRHFCLITSIEPVGHFLEAPDGTRRKLTDIELKALDGKSIEGTP